MKNRKIWRIVIIVLLVCSAILAFGPCVRAFTIDSIFSYGEEVKGTIELEPFFNPIIFSIISIIEIWLVFYTNKVLRIIGILLQIAKNVAVPVIGLRLNEYFRRMIFTAINWSSTSYSLTILSYVLFFLGMVITVLYFIGLFTKEKPYYPSGYLNNPETEKTQQNP